MYRFSLLVSFCVCIGELSFWLRSVRSGEIIRKETFWFLFFFSFPMYIVLCPEAGRDKSVTLNEAFWRVACARCDGPSDCFPLLWRVWVSWRERENFRKLHFLFFFFFLIFVDFLVFGRLTCVCHLSGIPASNEPWTLAVRSCRHILPELLLFLTTTTTRNSSYSGCFRKLTFFLPFPLPLTSEGDHSNRDAANEDFRSCTYIRVLSWWAHFAVGICSWWRFSFLHFIFSLFLPLILFFKIRTSADICLARGVKWVVTLAHFFFFLLFSRKQSSNARHLFQKTFVSVFPPLNKFKKKTHTHTKKLINSSI